MVQLEKHARFLLELAAYPWGRLQVALDRTVTFQACIPGLVNLAKAAMPEQFDYAITIV
jgi:hypothetical protein